ncbi:hypothetical protein PPL_03821 [Heterostelium album PN500]|uniref:Uncharacterized protein n=1 Tax=Heterostelium pallidum (strain ATCC 26659 / Pp 5 / PN500) TaxID=670386 RepID=D3B6R6_HETP5|nr:hypothetical protein PPL_03821 [Heterostelium album PN500]EFA83036.1 hypothetical protein PPL_03821 [Heterostelium album PN500]|eukprot:XP_020435153.1 hypothetical protein PPL_03821 [Heterostelium album PN500]
MPIGAAKKRNVNRANNPNATNTPMRKSFHATVGRRLGLERFGTS